MKKYLVVAVVFVCLLIIIPASIGLCYVIKIKPYYEISEDILNLVNIEFPVSMSVEYERSLFEELFEENDFNERIKFFKDPVKALTIVLLRSNYVDFEIIKNHYEQKLAEMELTAIALVINAFSAENQRMPESISELSKWFGKELPKNRFTNQPYELDLKGKHILYNKGADGIENLDSKETDDIYFDFSL